MVKEKYTDLANKGLEKYNNLPKKDQQRYSLKYSMAGRLLRDLSRNNFFEFVEKTNL